MRRPIPGDRAPLAIQIILDAPCDIHMGVALLPQR